VRTLLIVESDHQDSIHHRHAKQRDKTDRCGDAEMEARDVERENTADDRVRNARECQNRITKIVEQARANRMILSTERRSFDW